MKSAPDFVFARKMQTGPRFMWIAGLAAIGFVLQLFISVGLGWLFVLVAVMLGTTRGKSNEPKLSGGGEWRNVTIAEIEAARKLISESAKVKGAGAPFYLGSASGCGVALLLIVGTIFVGVLLVGIVDRSSGSSVFAPIARGGSVGLVFIANSLTLLLPMWMSGRVKTWQPPNLEKRIEQLWYIYRKVFSDPELEFQPSMQIVKTKQGSVPLDCRLMVKFRDSAPEFMGIQIQTAINTVQGTSHPYTYCVLVAKPEFGLKAKVNAIVDKPGSGLASGLMGLFADSNARKEAKFARFHGAIVESKAEGDVEIAVVRQQTSGRGYTTSPEQAYQVYLSAYALAKQALGKAL